MSEWHQIETAPKDGSEIDGWRGINSMRLTNMKWVNGKWWWTHYGYDEIEDEITHWMPIPPPPKTSE